MGFFSDLIQAIHDEWAKAGQTAKDPEVQQTQREQRAIRREQRTARKAERAEQAERDRRAQLTKIAGQTIKGKGAVWDGRVLELHGRAVQRMRRRGPLETDSMYGQYVGMRMRRGRVSLPVSQIASVGKIGGKIQIFTTGGEEYRFKAPTKLVEAISAAQQLAAEA